MTKDRINCFRCGHFYVTWDPVHPRGCRALGFKGREMPSQVVREASGVACLQFEPSEKSRRPVTG